MSPSEISRSLTEAELREAGDRAANHPDARIRVIWADWLVRMAIRGLPKTKPEPYAPNGKAP